MVPVCAGTGCEVPPGCTESIIPVDVYTIPCKGRLVANPQTFLVSPQPCDVDAASSSADNAASASAKVSMWLRTRCMCLSFWDNRQCTGRGSEH